MNRGLNDFIFSFLDILNRRKWYMILFAIIVLAYTFYISLTTTKMYKATAQVESPLYPMRLESQNALQYDWVYTTMKMNNYHKNEMMYIKSAEFVKRVFEKLPDGVKSSLASGSKAPISVIADGIIVNRVEDTDILTIDFVSDKQDQCAIVANVIADEYFQSVLDRYKNQKKMISSEVDTNMIPRIEKQLTELRHRKISFLNSLGFSDVSGIKEARNTTLSNWKSLVTNVASLEQDLVKFDAKKQFLKQSLEKNEGDFIKLATVLSEQGHNRIGTLLNERVELQLKLKELSEKYKDKWPELIDVKNRIGIIENSIYNEIKSYSEYLDEQITLLKSQHKTFSELKDSMEGKVTDINRKLVELDTLNSEIDALMQQYTYYKTMASEAGISQYVNLPNVRILKRAVRPVRHFKPDLKMNFIIGVMVAFIGGIGIAYIAEAIDSTVRYPDELEKMLGSGVVGIIPTLETGNDSSEEGRQPVIIDKTHTTAYECLKKLEAEINFYISKTGHKVFSILSASPLEGKTTMAINIANVLSFEGKSVLLIDADLRRPAINRICSKDPGDLFYKYMGGEIQEKDIIMPSSLEGVKVTTTKVSTTDSYRILRGDRFRKLIDYAKSNYDIVIIDTPPLLSLADGGIVAKMTDASLLVVRENFTKKGLVISTRKLVDKLDLNLLGIAINRVKERKLYSHYYGYYSYYSYYYNNYFTKYYTSNGASAHVPTIEDVSKKGHVSGVRDQGDIVQSPSGKHSDDDPPIVIT